MTPKPSADENHPTWATIAFAVVLAVTLFRVLVVFSSSIPLFFDEAQYWTWAQDLAFGYFSKPPVIAWVIAGTTALCGDGEGCVRVAAPLVHGATAMVVFMIGRTLYSGRSGFWAAATYATLPGVSLSAVIISTDVFLLFFWALAFLAFIKAETSKSWNWWLLFGMALGFGLLSKYAMVFFFLGLTVLAVTRQPRLQSQSQETQAVFWRRPKFWAAVLLGLFIYLPNLWWNWSNGFPSYRHTGENINIGEDLVNPLKAIEFLASQFAVFGPILFAVFIALVFRLIIKARSGDSVSDSQRLLLAFSIPVIALIFAEAFLTRAHANWAATAYIAATVFVVGEVLRMQKLNLLKGSLALHVMAAAAFYNFDLLVRTFDISITPDLDPARRMRGWDHAGDWVEELRRDLPKVTLLFDDRKVMSELLYYVQPHPFDSVMWNPKDQQNNHYEMTTRIDDSIGQNFLYIIRHDQPDYAATSFSESQLIATFRSRAYSGDVLRLNAYLLVDFQGYDR
ncbi:MAG: glycosyltransferase family 39 protein [Rhodospirillaceae bacterium]